MPLQPGDTAPVVAAPTEVGAAGMDGVTGCPVATSHTQAHVSSR